MTGNANRVSNKANLAVKWSGGAPSISAVPDLDLRFCFQIKYVQFGGLPFLNLFLPIGWALSYGSQFKELPELS